MKGKKFHRLRVIAYKGGLFCICRCSCANKTIKTVRVKNLIQGGTRSCGCLRKEAVIRSNVANKTTHGLRRHPLYAVWHVMVQRCHNKSSNDFYAYGAKGISVCNRWKGPKGFPNFLKDMGERPKGMSIDRFPNRNGNYEPDNCRWATSRQQNENKNNNVRVKWKGKVYVLSALVRKLNKKGYDITYDKVNSRLNKGWPISKAINKPA